MASADVLPTLNLDIHKAYIVALQSKKDSFEYAATEHLRMSAVYWGLTAMDLMGAKERMACEEIVAWILKCKHPSGGFGGTVDHDPHILYTLSAVQILALLDRMDLINADEVAGFVASLQQPDGSFFGDEWGEVDTRFSYCALNCLALLGKLDKIDVPAAVSFVSSCMNHDGGFGCIPGAESHGGQIFCCVGALAIVGALHLIDADLLGWWLCERQVPGGGLNGRPEKLPDVCYSWWILSSLAILDRLDWIDGAQLRAFILRAQDEVDGGIADRPGDEVDVFHTFFGLCGLSLLARTDAGADAATSASSQLGQIDPVYALPAPVLRRLGLPVWGDR